MMGGSTDEAWGFTIVETMIVLVVTGVILGSAIVLVSGKQARTQFQVDIRQTQSQMNKLINQVSNGYYPNQDQLKCQALGAGPVQIVGGNTAQGENEGCIYLGKVVQFGQGASVDQQLEFPVAGRRLVGGAGTNEVTKLSEAQPLAIANSGKATDSQVDLSALSTYSGGITVTDMWINNSRPQKTNALAFYTSFANYESDNVNLKSGTLNVDMYSVNTTKLGVSGKNDAINAVNANNVTKISQADICLASGGTNQSGKLTIGNTNGGDLSVTLTIMDGTTTC